MDVQPDDVTSLQPDVLVARPADFGPKNLPAARVLAVEVLSPTRFRSEGTDARPAPSVPRATEEGP